MISAGPQSPYQHPKSHRTVQGVVEAYEGDDKCAELRAKLEAEFRNKVFTQGPIQETDSADRPILGTPNPLQSG